MRSMFSNRYDKKRNEFYDNYEAARELHPSLPLYERPVEPDELMAFTPSGGRRLKSYRQMANHSREQLLSDSWLSSHTLPIAVRRNLELRIQSLLMPRMRMRMRMIARRRMTPRIRKEYELIDVVGYYDPESTPESDVVLNLAKFEPLQEAGKRDCVYGKANRRKKMIKDQGHNLSKDLQQEHNHYPSPIHDTDTDEDKENIPLIFTVNSFLEDYETNTRYFVCPVKSCQEIFVLRRDYYKHQRDSGHHSWSHKCDKCGQIFRTAGFKRMHADKACELNLKKKKFKTE
ncbi:hypothetical protein M5D96_012076 [Drosophila gunungcola]|uniref:C2H2-type domain-containing protein n=1 Tax=Drosophila gunungcola TaxID=103775 RepID=A0A9P9YDY5_9MUSC|nr:hypothetical protein M5D96_012076 [Drosophila gunungcola]